jgi:hypothetical protein
MYRTTLQSPKIQRLKPELFRAWVNILCCTEDDGRIPDIGDLAFHLRLSEEKAAEFLTHLTKAGLIDRTENGFFAHDWDEYQYSSDGSSYNAEKQRRYREKRKALPPVEGNDPVTRYDAVTTELPPRTDTDTDTEKNMSGSATPDGYPPEFEQFWKAYPRTPNMSKSAALKSWKQQKSHLPPLPSLLSSVAKYRAFLDAETKKQGRTYPAKHAQGWLSERRWEGYISEAQAETTAATAAPDWADDNPKWAAFKRTVPATAWNNFFAVCRPNGSESTLIAPTAFVRDQIESRYGSPLFAIFNDFKVKVEHP